MYGKFLPPCQAGLDPRRKKNYIADPWGPKRKFWIMGLDLKQAIMDAGGYSRVARRLTEIIKKRDKDGDPVTKQVIWSWVNVLERVPAEKVMELEEAIGIPRSTIRPDIYPKHRELKR